MIQDTFLAANKGPGNWPLFKTVLSRLSAKKIPKLWSQTYDRVKPSGAIFSFTMLNVVIGPRADNAPGKSEKTVRTRASPAERSILE